MTLIGSRLTEIDTSEAVLAQIAAIIDGNLTEQKDLATAASADPGPYNFRVFSERDNPFMIFQSDHPNPTPAFNVRWDGTNFAGAHDRNVRHGTATYHVECLAAERAEKLVGMHKKADVIANATVRRGLRLARRFLEAATNYHLGLTAQMVRSRQVSEVQMYRRDPAEPSVHGIAVGRLTLSVDLVEYCNEIPADVLEILNSEDLAGRLNWFEDFTT